MKLGTTKQESLMEPGSQPPVSSETMVESLRASHFVHTCLGYVLRWPQSVTSILILGRKEGKALKTLDDFICFTFGYPSLFIAHIHKIIPINVCMLKLHIAVQSIHQTIRSFAALPLREQGVHSCNLLLLLDANNMNELQVKFVSQATILNAIFNM